MQIVESIPEMQSLSLKLKAEGKKIAFVPTMGFLHEGHLTLVDKARALADIVVVSIYVNPTQFGPNEDFDKYPRDTERDLKLCEERGADYVFFPHNEEIYPAGYSTYIVEESLSTGLCGISRPTHFRGVATVVVKLFNIVMPDIAVFGQKDAQQVALIKKIVKDLHLRIDIHTGDTVREADGLAMSSRNKYLTEIQRQEAASISRALFKARSMIESGIRNVDRINAEITHILSAYRTIRIIYVAIVDRETMQPMREIVEGKTLIAVAVWCREVRLIDNILV